MALSKSVQSIESASTEPDDSWHSHDEVHRRCKQWTDYESWHRPRGGHEVLTFEATAADVKGKPGKCWVRESVIGLVAGVVALAILIVCCVTKLEPAKFEYVSLSDVVVYARRQLGATEIKLRVSAFGDTMQIPLNDKYIAIETIGWSRNVTVRLSPFTEHYIGTRHAMPVKLKRASDATFNDIIDGRACVYVRANDDTNDRTSSLFKMKRIDARFATMGRAFETEPAFCSTRLLNVTRTADSVPTDHLNDIHRLMLGEHRRNKMPLRLDFVVHTRYANDRNDTITYVHALNNTVAKMLTAFDELSGVRVRASVYARIRSD